ncbi:MAG TPA: tripartite tricarboxylate transporter TctB family protein [Burkholderiales bacterium]|nr:tripartite tricarboxylate transporter TctB family protein [Burkholderiales bacterium]
MADRALAVFMIVLAVVYLFATTRVPVLQIGDPLGPRAFPYLVGIAAITAAVWLLVEAAARTRTGAKDAQPAAQSHHPLAVALVLAWMLAFYTVLEALGFIVATALFLLGLTGYFNRNRWVTNIFASLLFPIGVYIAFTRVLSISLPRGVLPF